MYTELHAHSHFSFLDGAAAPEALAARAAELGMDALAVTDHQGLYGSIKHRNACREAGIRPIYGAAVTLADGGCLTLLVEDATGWANLCRLLSAAGLAGSKHQRAVPWALLEQHQAGLVCLSGPNTGGVLARSARAGDREATLAAGRKLKALFGAERCYVEIQRHLADGELRVNATVAALAEHLGLVVGGHEQCPPGHRGRV
jgi:error-prone DNA polymerase